MQAGLVSQRLALRDIFTAGGLTRRIFVAVVHVSVTVQPTALIRERPDLTKPSCRRAARRRLGDRLPDQQRTVQAPVPSGQLHRFIRRLRSRPFTLCAFG